MRRQLSAISFAVCLLVTAAPRGVAQQRAGVMGDLIRDVTEVQGKFVGLAREIPVDKYTWRPGAGVRSVSEVFLHIAGENYLMATAVGVQPEASLKLDPKEFATFATFEKQKMNRDEMVASLNKSFAHVLKAMESTPDAKLNKKVTFFGQQMTVRQVWIMTATHMHEHLGQLIAYARTNNVTPPWSKKGG